MKYGKTYYCRLEWVRNSKSILCVCGGGGGGRDENNSSSNMVMSSSRMFINIHGKCTWYTFICWIYMCILIGHQMHHIIDNWNLILVESFLSGTAHYVYNEWMAMNFILTLKILTQFLLIDKSTIFFHLHCMLLIYINFTTEFYWWIHCF